MLLIKLPNRFAENMTPPGSAIARTTRNTHPYVVGVALIIIIIINMKGENFAWSFR